MASRHKHKYPSKKELTKLNKQYGFTGTAEKLGIAPTTLHSYCKANGIPTGKEFLDLADPNKVGDLDVAEEEMLRQRVSELEAALRKNRK